MSILNEIAMLCESRYTSDFKSNQQFQKQLQKIKKLSERNANMLDEILYDYIQQNEPDPTYRKARLKAAKRMLGTKTGVKT